MLFFDKAQFFRDIVDYVPKFVKIALDFLS
jgi:hypothetical protein